MYELLWLLLPVAAVSGWWMAKRDIRRTRQENITGFSPDYIKGLNYLLNEQPDKAIEVFIHMLEVNSETVETHLALGHLFRRRGEVDRAIRIHQNLIARPTLSREQRAQALLALGEDYMRAGLLDRAESLFLELIELDQHSHTALGYLLDLYQQEKDWKNAIIMAQRFGALAQQDMRDVIAQFYCELAEQAHAQHDMSQAMLMLKRALAADSRCVRATLLQGDLLRRQGQCVAALKAYAQVAEQDIARLPEVLDAQLACYREMGRLADFIQLLRNLTERYHGMQVLLLLADLLCEQGQDDEARLLVTSHVRRYPSLRGLQGLQWLSQHATGMLEDNEEPGLVVELLTRLNVTDTAYVCEKCGFSGHSMHWQCPGCKRWNSIKPATGIDENE